MEALKSFFSGFAETFERYDNSGNIMADLQILEEITANAEKHYYKLNKDYTVETGKVAP